MLVMFTAMVVLVAFTSTDIEMLADVVYVGFEYDVGHVRVRL